MKRSYAKEMMDLPDQPRELLEQDLRNLRIINRRLGNYRNVVRGLTRLVETQQIDRFSLLDVGTGSGDIPAAIARWARRNGVAVRISALESEPVTVAQAALQTRDFSEVTVVRGDGMAPPFHAASFDFVLASQLLHHFSEEQIIRLLRIWSPLARRAIIVSDLVRHPLAYYGIRLLTKLFTRNAMTRTDAPLSVARAFTLAEWRALLREADVGPFQIFSVFPFRVMALIFAKG
ncbi:MAG: methyltransferase domain-containing protein [Deltaproteobacteria bacterium]|nr:methyltransferase domain-containing protein [Deltaproteobacteria bacterium]MDZ4345458.1 methyltransferase domain-containing protein [Candidatus Binatia bacterium]